LIYDPMTGALYGDDGVFIKTVYCPMTIRLDELQQMASDSPDRWCGTCGETVYSIDDLSDAKVRQLSTNKADACLFATQEAKNVVFLRQASISQSVSFGLVRIRTARNIETMIDAQKRGYILNFKEVGNEIEVGDIKFLLLQNRATGELQVTQNMRVLGGDDFAWEIVKKFRNVRFDKPFPLAAYLIPKDLAVDSEVYVEDVIEDIQVPYWDKGHVSRVVSSTGWWTGKDIEFLTPPAEEVFVG